MKLAEIHIGALYSANRENGASLIYVTDFYDMPISGLCWYKGEFCRFDAVEYDASIYRMTAMEKLRKLIRWKWFCVCVGTHWNYSRDGRRVRRHHRRSRLGDLGMWLFYRNGNCWRRLRNSWGFA